MSTRLFVLLLLALCGQNLLAQKVLHGKVIDEANDPVVGVNINIKELAIAAVTDIDGNFSINQIPAGKYTALATYPLYLPYQASIDFSKQDTIYLNIKLLWNNNTLNQVEIVEYKAPTMLSQETVSMDVVSAKTYTRQNLQIQSAGDANAKQVKAERKVTSIAATTAGVYQGSGSAVSVRGRRVMDIADVAPEPDIYDDTLGNTYFRQVKKAPFSTFSIDVDDASYSILRRNINGNMHPRADEVRTEELINYFQYNYPYPATTEKPFSVYTEMSACPWNPTNKLLHIGIQGYDVQKAQLPPSNIVLLVDVSGSMMYADKLPLVKKGIAHLVANLTERDLISVVVYASDNGVALPPTRGNQKQQIMDAIDSLTASGSTNGGEGIKLAYKTAEQNFIKDGNNRVILCTDGDFNLGISSEAGLIALIEEKRESGVFLSVVGCGSGGYQDSKMESLADHGNGYYGFMDSEDEGKRIFSKQLGATLLTIAKDVKLQVEFNPAWVKEYKLIGYDNRLLQDADFSNDKKDAGELGAGSSVTALYEVVLHPQAKSLKNEGGDKKLDYANFAANDLAALNIRYKLPSGTQSQLSTYMLPNSSVSIGNVSADFNFSAAVAVTGMLLKGAENKGNASLDMAYALATKGKGGDKDGYRGQFIELLSKLKKLDAKQ